jgi:hypothetical protein
MELGARANTTDQYIKPATDFFEAVERKLDGTLPASRRGSIKHRAADEDNSKMSNKLGYTLYDVFSKSKSLSPPISGHSERTSSHSAACVHPDAQKDINRRSASNTT